MKIFFWLLFLIFGVTVMYAQTLDSAIEDAARGISGRLPEKSTVVVISFQSDSERLTNYVLDELNGNIANIGKVKPVERRQLNAIRSELNFNMSGDVSDESAQNIGRMLGSQYIIMGSIDFIGNQYRIRFRVITTETASIEYSFSKNIKKDTVLGSILSGTGSTVNFTPQERWGASGLNLFFGIGSFSIQKDNLGGGITAALEGLGVVSMIGSGILYEAFDAERVKENSDGKKMYMVGSDWAYLFYGGLGSYVIGAVYGIIRAQAYNKPGSQVANSPIDNFQLNLVALDKKNTGVQITYRWKY